MHMGYVHFSSAYENAIHRMVMEWRSADSNEWKLKYLFMQEADSGDGPSTRCTRFSSHNATGSNRPIEMRE